MRDIQPQSANEHKDLQLSASDGEELRENRVLGGSAICAGLNHGNSSHHDFAQIVGLGSLLAWVPALAWYLRRYAWNPDSRPWLTATLCWWAALVVSGFISFLPGLLDRIKFTHALVAHAHLAMAGLLTSVNMLVLLNLAVPRREAAAALAGRGAFLCWHGGLLPQIAALSWLTRAEVAWTRVSCFAAGTRV